MLQVLFGVLLAITSLFLILLVLVQRGRGGGLAGALGGMGGQSAFGAKAGDLFTRITIGAAIVWVILCVAAVKLGGAPESPLSQSLGRGAESPSGSLAAPEKDGPAPKTDAPEKSSGDTPAAPEKEPAGQP